MIGKTTLSQSFEATLRYVYSKPDGVTVDAALSAGMTNDPMQIAAAMSATAKDRSAVPCYHISLSPAQGDSLSLDQWHQMSRDFMTAIGADAHEMVAVLHQDATYPDGAVRPHLHLVINRFTPDGPQSRALCLHFPDIERVIRKLEQDYGLQSVPCSWEVERRGDAAPQHHRMQREGTPSVKTQLRQTIDQTIASATSVNQFVEALQKQEIAVEWPPNGIRFKHQGISFAGYQMGRAYSGRRIEQALQHNIMIQKDSQQSTVSPATGLSMAALMQQAQQPEEIPLADPMPVQNEPEKPRHKSKQQTQPSDWLAQTGAILNVVGQTIGNGSEIDGMTLGGMGSKLAGAALTLSDLFLKRLNEAKQQAQSERAQALLDQLEQIGQRTGALEDRFSTTPIPAPTEAAKQPERTAARAVPTPLFSAKPQSEERTPSEDPLTETFGLAQQRLTQLERQVGLPPVDYPALTFDREAPIDDLLDQMESALQGLQERLEKLEQVVQIDAAVVTQRPTPEAVAESLLNYVQSRAQYYRLSPTDPVTTRTMGTIELSQTDEKQGIALVDPSFGAKFEAVKREAQWEIISNDLSAQEAETIVGLPQSPQAYESVTQGRELIRTFQKQAPKEFEKGQGHIVWKDQKQEFSYRFNIATNEAGSKTVIGIDQRTEKVVMESQIKADGSIRIDRTEIPKEHLQSLIPPVEVTQSAQSNVTQLRRKQPAKTRELTL